jgi:hypothetical protein
MSQPSSAAYGPPSSWLIPAIVTTLCCMPITGVVAVYYAAQVRTRWDYDDPQGASSAASAARFWVLLGFVIYVGLLAFALGTGALFEFTDRLRD